VHLPVLIATALATVVPATSARRAIVSSVRNRVWLTRNLITIFGRWFVDIPPDRSSGKCVLGAIVANRYVLVAELI
jgi:hypothetical protein